MTRMVFESAALADSVRKAAQVAPRKSGAAFDKAAGIVLEIYPGESVSCIIKATDTNLYYSEVVSSLESSGPSTKWRLPTQPLETVVGSLPKTANQVTFEQVGNKISVSSGRMKASLILMDVSYYPDWDMFDEDGMVTVSSLGGRLAQVQWATSSNTDPPFGGIYLTGTHAIATDRYRMARTPCAIELPRPIIVPNGVLASLLGKVGDLEVSVSGGILNIAPDPYTQIRSSLFGGDYPPVDRVMRTEYPRKVTVNKTWLSNSVKNSLAFAGSERDPVVRTIWGKEQIATMMDNQEIGMLGDVIDVPGQIDHKRTTIWLTPKYLIDALDHAPNETVTIGYDDETPTSSMYIDGGSGWEAWIQTRAEPRTAKDS